MNNTFFYFEEMRIHAWFFKKILEVVIKELNPARTYNVLNFLAFT